MKRMIAAAVTLIALASLATAVEARPRHLHTVCHWQHHHQICHKYWR